MSSQQTPVNPWYKEVWVWFILGILGLSVVLGTSMLVIATNNPPGLLSDNYYDVGKQTGAIVVRVLKGDLFGPVMGFVYNYVGICIGSLLAFAVARNCGRPLLSLLFSEKLIAKYSDWTERNDRFARLFALAIFFPVAPDDFLCYLAGTTSMTWRRFTTIILLGKPLSIALYSLGLTVLFQQITGWLG